MITLPNSMAEMMGCGCLFKIQCYMLPIHKTKLNELNTLRWAVDAY